MKNWRPERLALLALALAVPLTAGCASQKKLKDYESEIMTLREERTSLKKENQNLRSQVDSLERIAIEANAKTADLPPIKEYSELDAQGVGHELRDGRMVLTLPSEITFPSGSAQLTSKGKTALKTVAGVLKQDYANANFWVEGHTDSDPIKKSKFPSNRDLSLARSMAVLHYLVEECGLDDKNCVVAGHGQYSPLAENTSNSGKARNRRVEIVVHERD